MPALEREKRHLFLTGAVQFIAALLFLAVCLFLFKFEAFHSSQGAKIFPPLLFLSGFFFYKAYQQIKRMARLSEQQKSKSEEVN